MIDRLVWVGGARRRRLACSARCRSRSAPRPCSIRGPTLAAPARSRPSTGRGVDGDKRSPHVDALNATVHSDPRPSPRCWPRPSRRACEILPAAERPAGCGGAAAAAQREHVPAPRPRLARGRRDRPHHPRRLRPPPLRRGGGREPTLTSAATAHQSASWRRHWKGTAIAVPVGVVARRRSISLRAGSTRASGEEGRGMIGRPASRQASAARAFRQVIAGECAHVCRAAWSGSPPSPASTFSRVRPWRASVSIGRDVERGRAGRAQRKASHQPIHRIGHPAVAGGVDMAGVLALGEDQAREAHQHRGRLAGIALRGRSPSRAGPRRGRAPALPRGRRGGARGRR